MNLLSLPAKVYLSFLLAAGLLGLTAWLYHHSNRHYAEAVQRVGRVQRVLGQLDGVLSLAQDAQTSQRGYIITRQERFLGPYYEARTRLLRQLDGLDQLTAADPFHLPHRFRFRGLVQEQFVFLSATIALVRQGRTDYAARRVADGAGANLLETMRGVLAPMRAHEQAKLAARLAEVAAKARRNGLINAAGLGVLISLFTLAAVVITADIGRQQQLERQLLGLNRSLRLTNHELAGASQQIQRYSTALELKNQDLEAFSYSVSHDLKAPLRSVISFSGILTDEYGPGMDAEGRRLLDIVLSNARTMNELIDALLRFSRLGRAAVRPEAVDQDALVRPLLAAATADWPGELALDVGPLGLAWADRPLIRQVWLNLLGNAVKFAGNRPVLHLRIWHERREQEDVYAVADNGAGFNPRYAADLFGVFKRLHPAEDFPGSGLGLAICQRIIVNHGGRIWAEGEEDRGATFYFTLPVSPHAAPVPALASSLSASLPPTLTSTPA